MAAKRLDRLVTAFDRDVKFVVRAYADKCKGSAMEADVHRLQKQINLVSGTDPVFLIRAIGPHMQRYEALLRRRDVQSFCDADFASHVGSLDATLNGDEVVGAVKKVVLASSAAEQSAMFDRACRMLDLYDQFVALGV